MTDSIDGLPIDDHVRARALDALFIAGRIALRHFGGSIESWDKTPGQPVTEADLEIDRYLRETLPLNDDGWLSEETEDDQSRLNMARVWIVDPIDGTRSFARGSPEFVISIALVDRRGPLAGWLLNPASGDLLEAYRDAGCWCRGERIRIEPKASIAGCDIVVSSGEDQTLDLAAKLTPGKVRRLGSLALKLMHVALGRADAYVTFRTVSDWDLAAGILAVREAGGLVTDQHGDLHKLNQVPPRHAGIIAAAPLLHATLLEISTRRS